MAGIAATVAITGEGPKSEAAGIAVDLAARVGAMVCVTVIAMSVLKKWFSSHDERTRKEAQQVAIERSAFIEASATRAQELNQREERLNEKAEQVSSYVMGIARRLDEALTRNTSLEHTLADTKKAYDDLASDHNKLIRETMQERADRFQRRYPPQVPIWGALPSPPVRESSGASPVRVYADPDGGHHPVTPIPLRRIPSPAARLADTPQHERPAESMGGPA
ncbi:hypothetical protein [Streptomyces sp. 049-1]|uniref:hypothetical protein n=1 Tax=Streptomyces sp. 049-1 TaxID=2789264 RepID=UPI003980911D